MIELLEATAAGAVWAGVFGVLALAIRDRGAQSFGQAVLAAYPVFFALQVLLANLMGAAGLLTTLAFRLAYGAALLGGAVVLVRGGALQRHFPPTSRRAELEPDSLRIRRIVLGSVGILLAGLTLFSLVSPVRIWDSLAYHMPMVASYVQNGALDPWPTQDLRQIYRVNAGELQMLNVALLARTDAWVELPNLLALVVLLTATFELGRLTLRHRAFPYVAVILVITAPQIVIGAASSKNDLVFTAVLLCSFYWMIRAGMSAGSRSGGHVLLAALSSAIAGATKVMGLNVVGAVGLLALVLAIRRRLQVRYVFLFAAGALATLLLLAGNVYLFNLGRSAVPVGVAPGEVHFTVGLANLTEAVRFYVFDLTLKRLVTRPVLEHDFMHYGYLFPFILALGVAAAFLQLRRRRYVLACLTVLGGALFLSVIAVRLPIGWDQRFMIWLVPTLAILGLSLVEHLPLRRVLALTWVATVLAAGNLVLVLALESDGLFRRSAWHLASTGSLARYLDVPNRRYTYMKDGFDTLDRAATAQDSILYVGTDDSWMYPLWGRRFTRRVEGVWDADHAADQIRSRRFRFVVVEGAAMPAIRARAEAGAAESGYSILVAGEDRTIFVRDDALTRVGRSGSCEWASPTPSGVFLAPRVSIGSPTQPTCDGAES